MTHDLIMQELIEILNNKFDTRMTVTLEEENVPLTSYRIGLDYIALFEFMMCVEETYNLMFTSKELQEKGFWNLNNICELVEQKST